MSLNDSSLHGCSGGPAEQTAAGCARSPGNDECRWYVAPACLLELGCLGVWQTATAPQQLAVQPHRTRQAVRDAFGTAGCPRCSSAAAIGVAEAPSRGDIDPADGRRPLRPRGALARSGRRLFAKQIVPQQHGHDSGPEIPAILITIQRASASDGRQPRGAACAGGGMGGLLCGAPRSRCCRCPERWFLLTRNC